MKTFILIIAALAAFHIGFAQGEQEPSPFSVNGHLETMNGVEFAGLYGVVFWPLSPDHPDELVEDPLKFKGDIRTV